MSSRIPLLLAKQKSCVLDSWVGDASASSFYFVEIFLVDLMFCCSCLKRPLRVVRERGMCLDMSLEVRPGHVIKFPFFIA